MILLLNMQVHNGHLAVVKFLVSKGADIHANNDYALIYASQNGHLHVVEFLLVKVLIYILLC